MDLNNDTMIILQDMAEDPESLSELYYDMVGFIQYQANQKEIEFDGFFKTK